MITIIALANIAALLGIAYLLAERLLDRVTPIQVQIVGPVALAENGAALRQAGNHVAHSVFDGTSLLASVILDAARNREDR